MNIDTDREKIEALLNRSVVEILPSKEAFKTALSSGKKLRFYIGTDATGTSLHLGHATNYMILERVRRMGHEVIFLVGDFTSRIGDPTDKSDAARKQLTRADVVKNVETWIDQIKPVIDIENKENPVKVLYNHDWLSSLSLEDVVSLAAHFTVQQMIERDMFEKRIDDGKPLYLHELLYPLMQGYDSVAMDVDVELCGSDQKFNALAGRTLLKKMKDKEKFVFITTLLENPTTKKKMMSKSEGTGVFLDTSAPDMYGALMAQPDENMQQLFVDCTWLSLQEIDRVFENQTNRDIKMRLAREITAIYHGEEVAKEAEQIFVDTFQQKQVPEDVPIVSSPYIPNMIALGIVASKSELTRLIEAGGVRDAQTGEKVSEIPTEVSVDTTLKIGKRRFVTLKA